MDYVHCLMQCVYHRFRVMGHVGYANDYYPASTCVL